MSTVATLPGKLGDAILQFPVMAAWARQNEKKFVCWLDKHSLKSLVPLFEAQPCVESVELIDGIKSYEMGGQPFDFGLETKTHLDHEIIHLGMRTFPQGQITMETLKNVPLVIDRADLAETPCFERPPGEDANRVVLHGTFTSHNAGVPSFWRALNWLWPELLETFEEIVFVGKPTEVTRARDIYPKATGFDDGGDFLKLAGLVAHSRLVIGAGSSVVALGGALKVPTIRVHDPIGTFPKVIWSNLGANQMNETERDLRRLWPEYRDRWLPKAVVAG